MNSLPQLTENALTLVWIVPLRHFHQVCWQGCQNDPKLFSLQTKTHPTHLLRSNGESFFHYQSILLPGPYLQHK